MSPIPKWEAEQQSQPRLPGWPATFCLCTKAPLLSLLHHRQRLAFGSDRLLSCVQFEIASSTKLKARNSTRIPSIRCRLGVRCRRRQQPKPGSKGSRSPMRKHVDRSRQRKNQEPQTDHQQSKKCPFSSPLREPVERQETP